jgi:hypothetical protein
MMMKPDSSPTYCPVPREQQPVVEYEALKDAWLFRWGTLTLGVYLRNLILVGCLAWLLVSPIAAASFPPLKRPVLFSLASTLGAILILALILLRIFLGWYYIRDRLQAEQVIYEESGWYDGQSWNKPTEVLARDRLIVSYQIEPILKRLRQTGGILLGLMVIDGLLWIAW